MQKYLLLASLFSFAAATGCPPTDPPAPTTGLTFDVFVVGDSWAELSQGSQILYSNDNMVASRLRTLGHRIGADHQYGFGGSSAASWAAKDPCAAPGTPCNNANVYARFIDDLAAAENPPFVYLSLGGNDLRIAGPDVDFSDPAARQAELDAFDSALRAVVADIINTRDDAVVVLAGYANFHFAGRSSLDNTRCADFWPAFFSATDTVDEHLVNALFAGDGSEDDGLVESFAALSNEDEHVFYNNMQLLFAEDTSDIYAPSRANTTIDCLHLQPGRQRSFVVAVVNAWDEQR